MYDREVFGFVPGKYSIDGGIVGGGDLLQGLPLADLVDDFFDDTLACGGGLRRLQGYDQPRSDGQPG